jgi:hypothetical protein
MSEAELDQPDANDNTRDADIDIEKLADLIYRLMRDDARLELARGEARARRRC